MPELRNFRRHFLSSFWIYTVCPQSRA